MRKIYLDSIPRVKARELFLNSTLMPKRSERVPVSEALGRVTAKAVFARTSLPTFPASAMDGIAVKAGHTFGVNDQNPLILTEGKDFVVVDTGDPIPEVYDAVIKIEDIHVIDEVRVEILSAAAPGQHVRPVGEDVVNGEIIVPAYHQLIPPDLGALLAGGNIEVEVLVKPRVVIIPTGDELVKPGSTQERGNLVEFNGTVIAAYLSQWGAHPILYDIVKDRFELLKDTVEKALAEADLVIINAGSSAGREDYTSQVIDSLGEILVHGVSTRPGKPTILGSAKGKPVAGVPGYPVSAYLALDWFVKPLIYQYYNLPEPQRPKLKVKLGRRIVSELGSEEFVRMTAGFIDNMYIANPLNRGAGVTMSLVKAHGLLTIPAESLGVEQGEEVEIELFRSLEELKNTLVVTGSHDLALDLLATAIREDNPQLFLSSSHVGSMGGILAIKKREAHLAGIHLFDAQQAQYNIPYVEKLLASEDVVLVNLVYRTQGWIVEKGNPMSLQGIKDIVEKKAVFINRQKGAGTRVYFDYLLGQEGFLPEQIYGYEREEYTHLNVAASVAAGSAQAGMGILPAARAYDLDFIPVAEERYDLLMTRDFYESSPGRILLNIIKSTEFRREVESLGGYSLRDAGKVFYPSF